MKKLILLPLSIVLLATTFFWTSCFKTDDGGWTDEEKASYEEVLSLQEEVSNNLDEWFLTMDSLDAIDMVQQSFADAPNVSKATINNKGIAVQYANGMRGGLFLKGKLLDYKKSTDIKPLDKDPNLLNNLKSLVNGRKMLQMDAAYTEFSYYTSQVHDLNSSNLSRVGISITEYLKDSEVTLDRLTQLTGYGIIDMSGHGIPWPKENYITEIYYLTGETANETTSKKYWDDIKTGSIPVVKTMNFSIGTKYCVSSGFISSHNDFSNDTIFFYGGFCYSFLGGWPDIIDDFGDGAYLGFDWSVQGYHCANWDINSLALMSDTSKTEPMTLEEWMNDGAVDKSYSNQEGRTVSIQYTGDGNLTLWGDISINIVAQSDDGAPVSKPGEAGVGYPFKCNVVSNISELEYIWDIGDGSSPVTASDEVTATWAEDGRYKLKVEVKDKSNGNSLGTAMASVQIGNDDILNFILSCNTIQYMFGPQDAIEFSPPGYSLSGNNYVGENIDMVWNGFNFSAINEWGDNKTTIDGSLSNDGKTISLVVELISSGELFQHEYTYTVTDLPFSYYEPNGIEHAWDRPGVVFEIFPPDIQNHLSLSGYVNYFGIYNVTGINWSVFDKSMITIFKWEK